MQHKPELSSASSRKDLMRSGSLHDALANQRIAIANVAVHSARLNSEGLPRGKSQTSFSFPSRQSSFSFSNKSSPDDREPRPRLASRSQSRSRSSFKKVVWNVVNAPPHFGRTEGCQSPIKKRDDRSSGGEMLKHVVQHEKKPMAAKDRRKVLRELQARGWVRV